WSNKVASNPMSVENAIRRLFLDILLFPFVNQDLQSLLREKRKHYKTSDGISPSESHLDINQHRYQQDHRKIGIAEGENRCCFQRLTPQFYCKQLHIRSHYGNYQHGNRSKKDAQAASDHPIASPQLRHGKPKGNRRAAEIANSR